MNQYYIEYFSVMRECAGRQDETFETESVNLEEIYRLLDERYSFRLNREHIRVAVNDEFADWSHPVVSGDKLVFMTPVSGG